MEPLIELPRHRWHQLLRLYREFWPQGVVAACILESQISCPGLQQAFNFKVYCPGGDISKGMVAMNDNIKEHLELMIHPLQNGMTAIESALLHTSIIDWNRPILVASVSSKVITILEGIKDSIGVSVMYNESSIAVKHVLRRQSRLFENLSCPPHTYIGPLKPHHNAIVDKTWSYHSNSSHKFFETLMKFDLTYVLYSENEKPLAWITVNPEGELTHLFCLEEHRRLGYAEFVTKVACNDLLSKERDVLAYTIPQNVKASKLFNKLGFENMGFDFWLFIKKC